MVLLHAVQDENLSEVRSLVEEEEPARDEIDEALRVASGLGNIPIAQYLLEDTNADILSVDGWAGYAPLHNACENGRLEMVQYLSKMGGHKAVAQHNNEGVTPAMVALNSGHSNICKYLIETFDIEVNQQHGGWYEDSKCTFLQIAATKSDLEMATYLIVDKSANVDIPRLGTPLLLCLTSRFELSNRTLDPEEELLTANASLIDLLLDHGANIHAADKDGRTALLCACMCAASEGRTEGKVFSINLVKRLLENEADVNATDCNTGDTPLLQFHALANRSHTNHASVVAQQLLEHGANVNAAGEFNNSTALMYVCGSINVQRLEYLEQLIEHGADVNARNNYDSTPLMEVFSQQVLQDDHWAMIQTLLEHGADVNAQNMAGNSALFFFVHQCLGRVMTPMELDIFERLLNHGANVNVRDRHPGKSLLESVCQINNRFDNEATVVRLLESGARVVNTAVTTTATVAKKRVPKSNALHYACRNGHLTVAQHLARAGGLECAEELDEEGRKPHLLACLCGNFDIARSLLDLFPQINVDETGEDNNTPLHWAVRHNNIEMAAYLIKEKGASVNVADRRGRTPLHLAASYKQGTWTLRRYLDPMPPSAPLVALLMEQDGINVNAQDKSGNTALMEFASFSPHHSSHWLPPGTRLYDEGVHEILALLLQNGAPDVNLRNKAGETALLRLCKVSRALGSCEMAQMLLAQGASVDVRDAKSGKTCLHYACLNGDFKTAQALAQAGGASAVMALDNSGYPPHLSAYMENEASETLCYLVDDFRIDVNFCYGEGSQTLLHFAALNHDVDMTGWLLEQPTINVNVLDGAGHTPLYVACTEGCTDVIKDLLDSGKADQTIKATDTGNTPLLQVCDRVCPDPVEAVRCLVNAGADIHVTNDEGHNALSLAIQNWHVESMGVLLSHGSCVLDDAGCVCLANACRHNPDGIRGMLNAWARLGAG